MATPSGDPAEGRPLRALGAEDIVDIRNRFLAVNRQRLEQARQALPSRQQVFLEVLPFLFHVNHAMLPGFVGQDCPAGVAAYSPTEATIRAARRLARSFDYKKKAPRQFDVEAIYLMGSAGTIAYSRHSDFDLWLCHRPDLAAEGIELLQKKARAISAWAEELGLEAHFFVMTAEDFKAGKLAGLSKESSGTAQRHLLLDEFYRTAMLAGGRYPLWWLVPPDLEGAYGAHTRKLVEQRFIQPGEVVDFGGLDHIPSNEFFGASLWQLYKAMDSPYKSILKILLLESYAAEYPEVGLLSHHYKRSIYQGRVRLEDIDPYVQLFRKVESHLAAGGDRERLELARQAFFHRTSHHLRGRGEETEDKRRVINQACREWGWDEAHVRRLQGRDERPLEQVLAERSLLMNAMMTSYRFLSGFARERRELMAISEQDMTVLGRRLFAAFERKAGKVPRVFEDFVSELYEPRLTIERRDNGDNVSWLLNRGAGTEPAGEERPPLYRAYTLLELLAWCHFNSVVQRSTQVGAALNARPGELREIEAIRTTLRRHFPQEQFRAPTLEQLSEPSCPVAACLFVNLGLEPDEDYNRRLEALRRGGDDPLNSGTSRASLVQRLDLLYVTSWHEVFAFHYSGEDGLCECLADLLQAHREARRQGRELTLETYGFSADRGMVSAARLKGLHEDITAHLGGDREAGRFLLRVAGEYHLLAVVDDRPVTRPVGGYGSLLEHFAKATVAYSPVYFDRYASADSPLSCVLANYRKGEVRFFYFIARGQAYVYVLDEQGALFYDVQPLHHEASLLSQFSRFFDAIDYRETAGVTFTGVGTLGLMVAYYRLEQHPGHFEAVRVAPPSNVSPRPHGELQVITERVGEKTEMVVYYGNREFSTLDHGKRLFEVVAEHILARRQGREPYPIYITDIDLAGVTSDQNSRGRHRTSQYLRYKKRIERQLNNALRTLAERPQGEF